jgi:hypothetical protein
VRIKTSHNRGPGLVYFFLPYFILIYTEQKINKYKDTRYLEKRKKIAIIDCKLVAKNDCSDNVPDRESSRGLGVPLPSEVELYSHQDMLAG